MGPCPRRHAILLVCLLSLLLASCASTGALAPRTVRVLSYNIRHGRGMDGAIDLPRIAAVITALQPDLVALQEVDQGTTRSGGLDQAAELGRLCGMHAVFGKAMDHQGGGYGEAVLSRWPIRRSEVLPLPASAGFEPRAAMMIEVDVGGLPLRFLGTHLDHQATAERRRQIGVLNARFPDFAPTILAGDLNAGPASEEYQDLRGSWHDFADGHGAGTYPADAPVRRIDYVLVRPASRFQLADYRVVDERLASDHRPVWMVLDLLPPPRTVE